MGAVNKFRTPHLSKKITLFEEIGMSREHPSSAEEGWLRGLKRVAKQP
jgi:hypothetical protein